MFELLHVKSKDTNFPNDWRNYLTIVEKKYSKTEIEYILKIQLYPETKSEDIGYISIQKKGKYNFVKIVSVSQNYRGVGCGSMLYEYAIGQLGSLSTRYYYASTLAQRVWKRLIKKYKHTDELSNGILTVFKNQVDMS